MQYVGTRHFLSDEDGPHNISCFFFSSFCRFYFINASQILYHHQQFLVGCFRWTDFQYVFFLFSPKANRMLIRQLNLTDCQRKGKTKKNVPNKTHNLFLFRVNQMNQNVKTNKTEKKKEKRRNGRSVRGRVRGKKNLLNIIDLPNTHVSQYKRELIKSMHRIVNKYTSKTPTNRQTIYLKKNEKTETVQNNEQQRKFSVKMKMKTAQKPSRSFVHSFSESQ